MHQRHSAKRPQAGNILFLILLAVVLFAALSYAVTQSLRGGGQNASKEKAQTFASQLLQHVSLIENTITRAMLVNNIPEYGFDFASAGTLSTANGTCTSINCTIYSSKGGGVSDFTIPDWASTSSLSNERRADIRLAKVLNVGTAKDEVVIKYQKLTQSVCEAINQMLGIVDVDIASTSEIWGSSNFYTGTMTSIPDNQGAILGDQLAALAGKKAFCFQHSNEGYTFVYAIMER